MKNISNHSPIKAFLSGPQRRGVAALAILVLFLLNAAWSVPYASPPSQPARVEATVTLFPTISNLVNTPSLEEIQSNYTQTSGVAFFGSIIVLVIIAGTFFVLRRKS
jgi:hypothetical protein